ncbi:MAG: UDP-N-acetylglucosamine--N-acetylmuramyl-(pentapeptide) pyrophosphoryl-undecaprenol N-acetylglucosamine transferase [Victivallales bacterium]
MIDRLLIVCGGTGGHFYPGLSIAAELKKNGGHPKLFITGRQTEHQGRSASEAGIDYEVLSSAPLPKGLKGKFSFVVNLLKSMLEARKKIKLFAPEAVLVMGSFHSFAPAIASRTLGIPLFAHDGNARIGKANLLLSRFAKQLALSFPPVNSRKIKCGWTVTGMPVRRQITECRLDRQAAVNLLNSKLGTAFSHEFPIILVFGGSQGAEGINHKVPEAFKMQGNESFQVVHICGAGNMADLEKAYSGVPFKYRIIESSGEMEVFYSASDLVICRSGGSTVAELAVFAKFAILVPYPHATDNHQSDNADFYCSSGAGIKILEKELSVNKLASTVACYMENPANFAEKGSKGAQLAKPHASSEILELMENFLLAV